MVRWLKKQLMIILKIVCINVTTIIKNLVIYICATCQYVFWLHFILHFNCNLIFPSADRGPLQKHISKSASDLSDRSRSVYEQDGKIRPHSASSSGASHNAQNLPQKTQGFFSSLRVRI